MASHVDELLAIQGYIRRSHYSLIQKLSTWQIIDNGVIQLIHQYATPFIIQKVDAMKYSWHCDYSESNLPEWFNVHCASSKPAKDPFGHCKIVTIGAGGIGKTCLLIRYANNEFPQQYVPTVFDNYCGDDVVIDKYKQHPIRYGLWDTAGSEEYPRLRPLSYAQTDVFIVCMSVYDEREYTTKQYWTDAQIHAMAFCQEAKMFCPDIPCVLVGTKIDLRNDSECKDRCWSTEEMEFFASHCQCGFAGYVECSAKDDINVKETFQFVFNVAVESRKKYHQQDCVIL